MKHEYSRAEIERYLLGQGSEEERSRFAEELIADEEFHALVREVEAQQVDALARGVLKGQEAMAWREFFAATGQQDRLRVAAALAQKARPRGRLAVWLQVAAALLLTSGLAYWWTSREKPQAPLVAALRVSVDLPRGVTRGASQDARLQIPKDVTEVELRFEVAPEPASGYRLRLKKSDGETVLVREGKGWPSGVLAIVLPSAEIPEGMLELELSALSGEGKESPVGFHRIRVSRLN